MSTILHCVVDYVLPIYSMCGNCKTIYEVTHLGKVQNCKIVLQFVSMFGCRIHVYASIALGTLSSLTTI